MTDPKRAARIAKLRAIMALTSSDQPGEAQAAAEMAAKLKRRWGIEDAELEEGDASASRPLESVWTAEELRDQLLDQTPIIAGRHISPDSIRRAGWASWRYPLGLRTWQSTADIGNRPIEGATVIWLEAQFAALECVVVPRLARMYPSWTDGQISRAAAEALDVMFTTVDALSFPRMGDIGAFRAYLAAHPLPDRWLGSTGGSVPGRQFGESRLHLDMEVPRTAAIWGALLTEVRGVDDALIDVLLTEWEQGSARRGDQQRTRPAADPFTPPAARVRRDPFAPPSARVSRAPAARDTDTPPPTRGNGGMGMPRLRVRAAVLAVLAALVAIVVLVDQLRDDTTAPPPSAAVDASERVADQSRPAPEPSGDGDAPPPDTAAAALPTVDPPDADEGSDGAGGLVQRVIGTVSPLVGLLIGAFTGDETIEIGVVCSNRSWASDDVPDLDTPEDCRRAAEGGVHAGTGWTWEFWGAGFESRIPDPESDPLREQWLIDPDAIVASLNDGPPIAFNDSAFDDALVALPPGQHTLRVNEWRGDGEWSGWTKQYVFTLVADLEIIVICNARANREVGEWQYPATAADCGAAAADGLRTGIGWDWQLYTRGGVEQASTVYRFDGGAAFRGGSDEDHAAFDALAPGHHTIEAREQRPWGWTDWSAPYEFETVAVLEIVAICSYAAHGSSTYTDCKAEEGKGFDPTMDWWTILADGVVEWENVVYRFDGGEATSVDDVEDLWALAPGQHVAEIREQRPWGWTDWSPPYTFTVR